MAIFNPVLLIDEVRKRPCLYNTECPADREEKLLAWKEIGAVMYPDWDAINKATAYDRVLQLQKKWRSLKDAYGRELRSRRSGVRRSQRTYRYFKRLSFLGGHDGPISDGDESGDSNSAVPFEPNHREERSQESPEVVEVEVTKAKKRKRRKRKHSSDSNPPEEVEMPMFPIELDNNEERDCDKLFFMSFLPELRQLPSHIKMWVRAQVANVMQEAVACHYNNTMPGSASEQNDNVNVKQPPHDSPH